MTIEPL